jgi:hypothetical protein
LSVWHPALNRNRRFRIAEQRLASLSDHSGLTSGDARHRLTAIIFAHSVQWCRVNAVAHAHVHRLAENLGNETSGSLERISASASWDAKVPMKFSAQLSHRQVGGWHRSGVQIVRNSASQFLWSFAGRERRGQHRHRKRNESDAIDGADRPATLKRWDHRSGLQSGVARSSRRSTVSDPTLDVAEPMTKSDRSSHKKLRANCWTSFCQHPCKMVLKPLDKRRGIVADNRHNNKIGDDGL